MKKNIALFISIMALIFSIIFLRVNINKEYNGPGGNQIRDGIYEYDLLTENLEVNGLTIKDQDIYYLLMENINEENIYSYKLKKLDVIKNEVTETGNLSNLDTYCTLNEELIYCQNSTNIKIYDLSLKEIFSYTKAMDENVNYMPYKDIFISKKDNNIYLIRNNEEELYRSIDTENTLYYENYYANSNNTFLILIDNYGYYYLYDINKNELTSTNKRNYMIYDEGIFFYDEASFKLYNLKNNIEKEYENPTQKGYYYSGNYQDNKFYLYDIFDNILYIQNLEQGTLQEFDASILSEDNPIFKLLFSNNYLYIYISQNNNNFYVIDLETLNLPTISIEEYTNEITNNINEQIKNIEDTYNVNINIKEEAVIEFPDFSAEILTNNELILSSLNKIKVILSKYNLEFFDSFYDNGYEGLNLYLTGSLTPSNYETQAANPAAYSLVYNSEYMIVIDLNQPNIGELLCHELLHNLEFNLNNKNIVSFSEWNTYNPEDYYYNFSYTGSYDYSNTLTEKDINAVYFIDPYSKTYPTEDRARVFEKVCSCESNSIVNEYPHLYQKSLYLKEEITKYYPSLANTNLFDSLN